MNPWRYIYERVKEVLRPWRERATHPGFKDLEKVPTPVHADPLKTIYMEEVKEMSEPTPEAIDRENEIIDAELKEAEPGVNTGSYVDPEAEDGDPTEQDTPTFSFVEERVKESDLD